LTLLPRLAKADCAPAIQFGHSVLGYSELRAAAGEVADAVNGTARVAVWAESCLETCVGVIGALAAGSTVIPLNPDYGERELEHILSDASPGLILSRDGAHLPLALNALPRRPVDIGASDRAPLNEAMLPDDTAFVLYTSGTTGPPKGAMIPLRAVTANLDALAEMWRWTSEDRLVHGLPLFHLHGLILGILGPLRVGGQVEHVGRFSAAALADALERGATIVFGVPTMYNRIVAHAEADAAIARAFGRARLLISGSAALPSVVHRKLHELTGQTVLQRYGLTETLILTGERPGEPSEPGTVGRPVPGVEVRLLDDAGVAISEGDRETIGEIVARGPSIFTGYLNRPDATADAFRNGWFRTGDLATHASGGAIRIVGRRATDLIKSGGYKIGAGEIESALLEHPAVADAAVAGREDPDLGERVVAWVVTKPGASLGVEDLREHVERLLASYKRPREVHFVDGLPRNAMGKVAKSELTP
jgi:malonyl-CoA/methylmalonyl-CoA synthetase